MSEREPIDSLQIEIESSSTDASKSLDALVSSLRKLDRIGKSNSFLLVKKRLKGIAEVRFDTLDKQLRSITKNIKTLEIYKKALKNLEISTPKIDTTNVSNAVETVISETERMAEQAVNPGETFGGTRKVEKPAWLDDMQAECDDIVSSYSDSVDRITEARSRLTTALAAKQEKFAEEKAFVSGSNFADTLSDKMEKLQLQATILSDKMAKLAQSDNPDQTQWNMLEKQLLAVRLQYQAIEQQTLKNAAAVEELGDKSKKTKSFLGKMFDKFKNVMFYRLVRTLLAQMTRAISAGLENIAKFSSEANSILSGYKTEFTYIQNSLGAALLPILQSLLPTIVRISDGLVDITNSIGMVSAALNGQNTFIKAKKYVQDYAEAVDDAKKSTTGFDELNILGNNTTTQNDASQMFETVDISGWDVAGSIAKITALVASITTLVMLIKGVNIGTVFTKMGKGIGTAYKYLKNASTWKKAGISIAALATEAVVCYTSFYDLGSGTKTLASTLLAVIPVCAAVGAAMYAMLGPWGLVAAAVVGVTSAVIGFTKGQIEARKELNNKHFYEGATEMSVTLDELASSFSNVWSEAESLAEQTENANQVINDCAKEIQKSSNIINYYLEKMEQTGSLSAEEAAEISNNVKNMVDNLETQMNTRMESIFNTFEGLATLCKENFVSELGEMQVEFLAFQKLLGNTTLGYQTTIDGLLDKATHGSLTEEEKKELQDAVTSLSALNVNYSDEEYQFDSIIEKALAGGIDFSNEEDTKNFLTDLGEKTNTYLSALEKSRANTDRQILEYMQQNQVLYDAGKISKAEYDTFNESFTKARENLQSLYDEAVKGVYDDVESVINAIQSSALSNMNTVYKKAKEDYANSGWWHQLWNSETDDVQDALNDVKNGTIKTLNNSINDFYNTIGSSASAWLKQSAESIINSLFNTNVYDSWSVDGMGNMYYTPIITTTDKGNIGDLIDSEITKNAPTITNNEGVWKSYQDAADAGYSNIRTRNEFFRGNNNDKQKYGTYEAYLEGMYKKYVLGSSTYATGGFPEDGLFFANHSELVGKFSNGKTAVANNEQIVEGIKRGVSEAMSESGGSDGGTWVIQIVDTDGNIKGEKIIKAAERKNRRDGKTVISIGG